MNNVTFNYEINRVVAGSSDIYIYIYIYISSLEFLCTKEIKRITVTTLPLTTGGKAHRSQ